MKRQRVAEPPPPPPPESLPPPTDALPGPPRSAPPPPEENFDQAQNDDIVPPPPPSIPPPPPPEQSDDEEEADVQDAAYWTHLAQSSASAQPSSSKLTLAPAQNGVSKKARSAMYLDTINRGLLDFDFEKLCCISLSNINVYACLVCGKYFQGRGRSSYAYLHSIDDSHHVFLNLSTSQTYILPDNYVVPEENQAALQDIKYLLNPTFTRKTIAEIDAGPAFDLNGEQYWPGFVGLNNIGRNDWLNAVVQALVHVPVIRDHFLLEEQDGKSELVKRFGALVRKMWNPKAFKAQVSPHEFLQQVAVVSGNRFRLGEQADPVEFLGWLLNRLHGDLVGNRRGKGESVVSRCFQGLVQVESQSLASSAENVDASSSSTVSVSAEKMLKEQQNLVGGQVDDQGRPRFDPSQPITKRDSPFFLLAMDLPTPPPVLGTTDIVPQITISQILAKYDGQTLHPSHTSLTRYALRRLPPYLIIHFRRFTKNSLGQEERNPTLVNFPIRGLDVSKYAPLIPTPPPAEENKPLSEVYDLLANVVYEAAPGTVRQAASWKSQVHTNTPPPNQKWFAIHDLLVQQLNRQMIFLGESYLQIWQKRSS